MNRKIAFQFTVLAYIIGFVFWGGSSLCDYFGFTADKYPLLNALYLIGAWSPAIASYVILRKNNEVSGLKEWLKNIFTVKSSVFNYLFVIAAFIIFMVSNILMSGVSASNPIYMFFVYAPLALLTGSGMEEAGWRYILYPALEKRFGYALSCLIITPIHLFWHVPLGIGGINLWNATNILGVSFAAGAIYKISKGNVFLCVIFHSMVNAGAMTIVFNRTAAGAVVTPILIIIASTAAVLINKRTLKRR